MNTVTNICVAAVREDPDLMKKAVAFPSKMTKYVSNPPGNGFYRDGTYINHRNYPYNFGYGGMVLGQGRRLWKFFGGRDGT